MIGKMHSNNNKKVFACCDFKLLEKTILFNNVEIFISKDFYGEKNISKKQFLENFKECDSANFFGEKVCGFLLENKIISKQEIVYFDKTPHVQIYKI